MCSTCWKSSKYLFGPFRCHLDIPPSALNISVAYRTTHLTCGVQVAWHRHVIPNTRKPEPQTKPGHYWHLADIQVSFAYNTHPSCYTSFIIDMYWHLNVIRIEYTCPTCGLYTMSVKRHLCIPQAV